jgi:hypothetical protein
LNSRAALAHLTVFVERFGVQYASMVNRNRFTVYGAPTSELRQMLDQFSPEYLRPFGNLDYDARWYPTACAKPCNLEFMSAFENHRPPVAASYRSG